MITFNKRLFFWLIKAYLKKWGKVIFLSFLAGLLGFFLFIFFSKNVAHLFPQRERIGIVGAYTLENLPSTITKYLSRGLTKVSESGTIEPDLALSWEIKDKGKVYIFHLKKGIYFSGGKEVTSQRLGYDFKDAKTEMPDKYTIQFQLKEPYSPFLVTLSRPIFPKGLKGLGDYTLGSVKINGGYVSSLVLTNVQEKRNQITYIFYPNQEALKTSFLLGETTKIIGVTDTHLTSVASTKSTAPNTDLKDHRNTTIQQEINYNLLVTLFYNTKNEVLSDNKLRKAISYSLPDTFTQGQRNYLPYSPQSIYFNKDIPNKSQDLTHSKLLIDAAFSGSTESAKHVITLKTLMRYRPVAEQLVTIWKKLDLNVKIEEVDSKPDVFEMYLGELFVPLDPDQYELWHSKSEHNTTRFDSKRIDLLLEDGRSTIATQDRKKIYDEFQKYLLDDALIDTPASFLYFPYSHTITRK